MTEKEKNTICHIHKKTETKLMKDIQNKTIITTS